MLIICPQKTRGRSNSSTTVSLLLDQLNNYNLKLSKIYKIMSQKLVLLEILFEITCFQDHFKEELLVN